jgi:2-polyprenyl-3-methyl-5-hydroxy-6-metoxy-1,4-benzoquinol methylase
MRDDVARPASSYAARGTYRIATCEGCGCGRTVPVPDEAELRAFYAKEYKYDAHFLIAREKRWRARRMLEIATPGDGWRGKRILDIGCMYGYLLEEASRKGASEAVGVELSAGPARDALAHGMDVFQGTVEAFAEERPARFDAIFAQHVLEHVADLGSFVDTARTLLAPGGRLCICLPNFDTRTRRIFPEAWGWYQVPVHLWHFGARSLTKLLEDHGFHVDEIARRGGDSLFVLLTLLQGAGRAPSSEDAAPGVLSKAAVRTASALLRPYYFVGDDELIVLATAR